MKYIITLEAAEYFLDLGYYLVGDSPRYSVYVVREYSESRGDFYLVSVWGPNTSAEIYGNKVIASRNVVLDTSEVWQHLKNSGIVRVKLYYYDKTGPVLSRRWLIDYGRRTNT